MGDHHGNSICRRTMLRYLTGAAVACPTCLSIASAFAAEKAEGHGGAPHWEYEGEAGPGHWGDLGPENRVCGLGLQQSPIDLRSPTLARLNPVQVLYQETRLRVVNNGHTIQCNCDSGSKIVLDGENYGLLQFHFHHPSEHLVDGKAFAMEAHLVHAAASGTLAVLGVLLQPGEECGVLTPIWDAMPTAAGPEKIVESVKVSPAALLPQDRRVFRYYGSLTTPPCSEKVIWSVFNAPVEASEAQVKRFAGLFPMNARPAQRLNRRFLLETL